MQIIDRNPKQRHVIKCRLAGDSKAPWHIYKRFCSKDLRDKELRSVSKKPKLTFLVFKAGIV